MLKQLFIFSFFIFSYNDLYALERGDCTPVFKGNIASSKIKLNCSKELPTGAKRKLEELLGAKFSGNENGECSPNFQGQIKDTEIIIQCGYPIEDIQEIIDDFLVNFSMLKRKLASLQVTEADTQKLQEQASQAIDAGEFDEAQALVDQIIKAEESAGQKALEQILAARAIYTNSQVDEAQAHLDAGNVAINQLECGKAIHHFEVADEIIKNLNNNSPKSSTELIIDKLALIAKVEACQQTRISNDLPLNANTEVIDLGFDGINTPSIGEKND